MRREPESRPAAGLPFVDECEQRREKCEQNQRGRILRTHNVDHYRGERNHQGINNRLIDSSVNVSRTTSGSIECRERLGGLLRFYERAA